MRACVCACVREYLIQQTTGEIIPLRHHKAYLLKQFGPMSASHGTDGRVGGWTDRWTDGWEDVWMEGRTDGWIFE